MNTLLPSTSCTHCGRGLFIDSDGDKYCLDCTTYVPVEAAPFVATVAHDVVDTDPSFYKLLGILDEIADEGGDESIALWQGMKLVAVRVPGGKLVTFPGCPAVHGGKSS